MAQKDVTYSHYAVRDGCGYSTTYTVSYKPDGTVTLNGSAWDPFELAEWLCRQKRQCEFRKIRKVDTA